MLIGCCMNLLAQGKDNIGIEQIELIASVGYDYVELPLAQIMSLSDEDFDALCDRVKNAGVPCRCCNNLFPSQMKVTGFDLDLSIIRAYLNTAFNRARRMGVSIVVFGSPASRNVEVGFPREIAMLQFIKMLQVVDEYLDDNLSVVIEHICHLEGNFIHTVKESCQIHDISRTKHIGVLADTYHMGIEQEPIEHVALAGKNLLHVHVANPRGRIFPSLNDGVDYKTIINTLTSIQYHGGISVEGYSENLAFDAQTALETLRQAMP